MRFLHREAIVICVAAALPVHSCTFCEASRRGTGRSFRGPLRGERTGSNTQLRGYPGKGWNYVEETLGRCARLDGVVPAVGRVVGARLSDRRGEPCRVVAPQSHVPARLRDRAARGGQRPPRTPPASVTDRTREPGPARPRRAGGGRSPPRPPRAPGRRA